MRSERICSLSRALMSKPASFANTLSTQWMERTLDDSAIRRKYYPAVRRGWIMIFFFLQVNVE